MRKKRWAVARSTLHVLGEIPPGRHAVPARALKFFFTKRYQAWVHLDRYRFLATSLEPAGDFPGIVVLAGPPLGLPLDVPAEAFAAADRVPLPFAEEVLAADFFLSVENQLAAPVPVRFYLKGRAEEVSW